MQEIEYSVACGLGMEHGPITKTVFETPQQKRRAASDLPDDHPAKRMLSELEDAFYEALEFPNEWIPAKLRDRKNKRRSIRFLQKAVERKERKVSQRDADKMAKASRIGGYKSDVDSGREILFHEDEIRTYNAHLRFCRIVGLVSQSDIDGIE